MPAASQRCMRFTVGALACNAACLGFVTGLAKAPSHGISTRTSHKSSTITMRGGPLRGLEAAGEAGGQRQGQKEAWQTRGRRFLSVLRSGQQDRDVGGEDVVDGSSADSPQSSEAMSVAVKVDGGAQRETPAAGGGFLKGLIPSKSERKKLLPLAAMFFCILFNYTILRDTKDVLVVTAPGSGAEIIPFLKTYVNLPAAIAFTVLYSKLNNVMSPSKVFYTCITPFLAFFASFAAFIYPARDALHPHAAADYLLTHLPKAFGPLISIFRNWTYAVFYTAAELWGSVVVSVLFWGLANQITTTKEAKKYYPLFGLGANVALIFSGQYVRFVSAFRASLPAHVDKWGASLKLLMGAVCTLGVAIIGIHAHVQKNVMTDPECVPAEVGKPKSKTATSMGLRESAKYLAASPYIRNLAILVIAYGMSINIVEVTWKGNLKRAFPDPNAYSAFMGNFSTATGSVTLMMMILGRFIFQKFGWTTAALVTPTVLALTGAFFFSLILFEGTFSPLLAFFGTTPLMAAVLIGAAQNILSKSSKYSLFDPCKEMAYINLDAEQKTKGKAAVDVIGNPLGKSGGSFIQQARHQHIYRTSIDYQVLIVSLGSLSASTPYLAAILVGIIGVWLTSAKSLGGMIKKFEDKEEADELAKGKKTPKTPSVVAAA
ncbi:unnamed protein product [Ectocarpus sp. 12 AP-2014]